MSKKADKIIIAIDGHSSCGKSTVAKEIARHFRIKYIDTGAMYRAFTFYAIRHGWINETDVDMEALSNGIDDITIELRKEDDGNIYTFLNGENVENEIRTLEVSNKVSVISALPEVRKKLVELQQQMGKAGGVVLDGRDIGTVVFPDADFKIFMTASPQVRAQRRYDEMIAKGEEVSYDDVLKNVMYRDEIDSNRKESPLKQADDAWLLDNSNLGRDEQMVEIFHKLKEKGWS